MFTANIVGIMNFCVRQVLAVRKDMSQWKTLSIQDGFAHLTLPFISVL